MTSSMRPGSVRVQGSVPVPFAPETVEDLLYPAENAPLLDPTLARGYRVPGTPAGVGEQQAFVGLDGTTTVIEIVEHIPGRRAVVRHQSPAPGWSYWSMWTFEPTDDGCILTFANHLDPPSGAVLPPGRAEALAQLWKTSIEKYLEIVVSALEREATSP